MGYRTCRKGKCHTTCSCKTCCKKKHYKKVCHLVPYYKTKCHKSCKSYGHDRGSSSSSSSSMGYGMGYDMGYGRGYGYSDSSRY